MLLMARAGANTAELRSVPIVFVPGIMGTRLRIGQVPWDPDSTSVMTAEWGWRNTVSMRGQLNPDNAATLLHKGTSHSKAEKARSWACLPTSFYGKILRELHARYSDADGPVSMPVYAFGYDWRKSNAVSATACARFARKVLHREQAEELVFVTHSMGGYVVRRALLDDKELGHKTMCVIHIGQPAGGAPVAYRRHVYGTARSVDGWQMRVLLGGAPEDTLRLFSVMPGAMQLLPNDARVSKLERAQDRWLKLHRRDERGLFDIPPQRSRGTYDLYKQRNSPPGIAVNLHQPELRLGDTKEEQDAYADSRKDAVVHLENAKDFHAALALKHHGATWTISSTGVETDERVVFYYPTQDFEGFRSVSISDEEVALGRGHEGDGTVPLWSAIGLLAEEPLAPGEAFDPLMRRQHVVRGVEHDKMCDSSEVLLAVFSVLDVLVAAHGNIVGRTVRGGWAAFAERLADRHFANTDIDKKSAEIELRAAKWYAENGADVLLLETRADKKMPDLQVDGESVEVKSVGAGAAGSVRSQILDGFAKADRTLLVRVRNATLDMAQLEAIGQEALADRPGNQLTIVEEDELPLLNF